MAEKNSDDTVVSLNKLEALASNFGTKLHVKNEGTAAVDSGFSQNHDAQDVGNLIQPSPANNDVAELNEADRANQVQIIVSWIDALEGDEKKVISGLFGAENKFVLEEKDLAYQLKTNIEVIKALKASALNTLRDQNPLFQKAIFMSPIVDLIDDTSSARHQRIHLAVFKEYEARFEKQLKHIPKNTSSIAFSERATVSTSGAGLKKPRTRKAVVKKAVAKPKPQLAEIKPLIHPEDRKEKAEPAKSVSDEKVSTPVEPKRPKKPVIDQVAPVLEKQSSDLDKPEKKPAVTAKAVEKKATKAKQPAKIKETPEAIVSDADEEIGRAGLVVDFLSEAGVKDGDELIELDLFDPSDTDDDLETETKNEEDLFADNGYAGASLTAEQLHSIEVSRTPKGVSKDKEWEFFTIMLGAKLLKPKKLPAQAAQEKPEDETEDQDQDDLNNDDDLNELDDQSVEQSGQAIDQLPQGDFIELATGKNFVRKGDKVYDEHGHEHVYVWAPEEMDTSNPQVAKAVMDAFKARNEFIESNIRLVPQYARKYSGSGVSDDDLIAHGEEGLQKAAEKFDAQKGFKFSTYASWWIRQNVERAVLNEGRDIRVPVHVLSKNRRIFNAQRDLSKQLECNFEEVPIEAVSKETGMKIDQIRKIKQQVAETQTTSFDQVTSDDDDRDGNSFIPDTNTPSPYDQVNLEKQSEFVKAFLEAHLKPNEIKVLSMRFGIDLPSDYTLEEAGKSMDLTRERIRQIEAGALRKLRTKANNRGILPEMFSTCVSNDQASLKEQVKDWDVSIFNNKAVVETLLNLVEKMPEDEGHVWDAILGISDAPASNKEIEEELGVKGKTMVAIANKGLQAMNDQLPKDVSQTLKKLIRASAENRSEVSDIISNVRMQIAPKTYQIGGLNA